MDGQYCVAVTLHTPHTIISIMSAAIHPLQHTWVIWEHKALEKGGDWKDTMREVCEFSSVEEFWKYWY
jgi:hypothetical protein